MSEQAIVRAPVVIPGPATSPIRDGAVLVKEGRIATIGTYATVRSAAPDARVVSETATVLLPGFVDGHSHARGIALTAFGDRPRSLEELCAATVVWPQLDPHDDALVAGADLIATGVTSVQAIVHGFLAERDYERFVAAVLAGLREAGLGVELAIGLSDQDEYIPPESPGLRPPTALAQSLAHPLRPLDADRYLTLFDRIRARWAAPDEGVDIALGPVAPQWCSDALLTACASRAHDGVRVHTHLHESALQVSGAYGPRPLARLVRAGLISPSLSVAHGVWLEPAEVTLLAERGVTVVHCPGSNTHLRVGDAPVRRYLDAGVRVGLGIDSHGHVDPPDVFVEIRHALDVAAMQGEQLSASEAFALATVGSSLALGRQRTIGELLPGARADMVALALDGVELASDPLAHVMQRGSREHVTCVWVGGRMQHGPGGHREQRSINSARARLQAALTADRIPRGQRQAELRALRPWLDHHWCRPPCGWVQEAGLDR